MTTPLPPNRTAVLRAVAKFAGVLLVCLALDNQNPGMIIRDESVADILGRDLRTVQKHMRALSATGLMLGQGNGRYVVTVDGRNTLFGFADRQRPSLSIEETPEISETVSVSAQNVTFMNEDEEDIKLNTNHSSSFISECTNCAQIVQATHLLFGESVAAFGLDLDWNKEWALRWVAKAYRDRNRLHNPLGMIYQRIKNRIVPTDDLMRRDPTDGLPDEYLDAVGYFTARCGVCRAEFTSLSEYESHVKGCQPKVEEEAVFVICQDETVGEPERSLWQDVLVNLEGEMPRASFETWVRDTVPVHYEAGVLQVGARNAYARDWLDSRMGKHASELAGCAVVFVTAEIDYASE